MVQLSLHWKYFFRQHGFYLQQGATVLGAFVVVYSGLWCIFGTNDADIVEIPQQQAAAFTTPQPNAVELQQIEPAAGSVADVSRDKAHVKVVSRSAASGSLSSIQSGIAGMLEASSRLMVAEKKVVVGRGDTLMDLLVKKAAVPRDDAYQVVRAISKVYNPRDIIPGREITVFFHKNPAVADSRFSGLRIEKDIINALAVNRDDKGHYTVKKVEKAVHRTLNGFKGTIDSSFYADAKSAGVPDAVILSLIKMYSWNVDFQREIHSGDKFEVMYEEYKTEEGRTVPGKGNIVYAKLALSGTDMPFYRFEDVHGDVDYYDNRGQSAKKPLMKTPVDGARLSSGFGMRKHPVLGFTKMHKGLDFGAPRGTPIYAAGDGTIVRMSPFSTYGNYVRIRHRAGLETAYAHMSRFKSGLHAGSRVKQGEVIGYVGTTGRSTGPHLHYEVIVANNQVNPSTVKLPTGRALKGKELKSFQRVLAQVKTRFNSVGHPTAVAENHVATHKSEKIAKN